MRDQLRIVRLVSVCLIFICMFMFYYFLERLEELASYNSSPIDWCETNFEVHEDIAEFWNSFSSIPIALVAPIGYMHKIVPDKVWIEFSGVKLIFVLIVLIGVGSTYFHATLSVCGQIMDEMSIIWLVLYSAFLVVPPGKYRLLVASAFLRTAFTAFIFSTTMLGLFAPHLSHVFVLSCVPFGLYVHIDSYKRSRNRAAKAKFLIGLRLFIAAWCCWLIDRLFCSQLQWIRKTTGFQPQLHACWHVLVAFVAYLLIGVCLQFREDMRLEDIRKKQVERNDNIV